MVALAALALPILLSAVLVFLASSLVHMVLGYHKSDYQKLPEEDKIVAALRQANLSPGLYHFPYCTHQELKKPEMQEKFKQGPVGLLSMRPNGVVNMGKFLGLWLVYCLLVGLFVAYLAAHTVGTGAPYRHVFRVVGTAAFLPYGVATLVNGIWKAEPWRMVFKEAFDGLLYALLTAGTFAWLWPR